MGSGASKIFPLRRFEHYARAAGAAAVVIGTLVLLGWLLDVSLLKSVLPGKVAMKPNTAICFVLAGASLLLLGLAPGQQRVVSASRRRAALVCATLAAAIGLATLCEYSFKVNLGIDNLLFRNSLLAAGDSGRMAEATTLGFLLLGGALLSLDARDKIGRLCCELFALATLLVGVIALLGYVYGIESLYGLFADSPIAVHTALLFTVLGLGVLLSRPESGLTSVITSERGGGVMARRIMPVAVFLLIALAWLRLKGGLALFVTSSITVLVSWVWLSARSLNALDAKREQALEALREKEHLLSESQRIAHVGSWVYDLTGRITWSDEMYHIYGVSPETFTPNAETFLNLIHPDDGPAMQRWIAACVAREKPGDLEFRAIRPDGTMRVLSSRGELICDAEGRPTHIAGTVQDITERKRAEEQLRLQSAALESAANAIMITDTAGKIIWVNPAFTQHTGYSFEEVRGKNPRLLKSGKQDRAFYQEMWETILSGKVWRNTIINRRKDGTLNHEDLTITPICNQAGKITHFVGIKQDITEKTRAQEALQASEIRYRRLFESAQDGILILDAESGQIVDVNPYLIEMLGFSKEELAGKELWEIGAFKDIVASKLAFDELQQRGYIRYENLPLESREGLVKQVEFVSNSYLAGESRVIQCNIRDITERKLAEEELRRTNQRLEGALAELQTKTHELASMTQQFWQSSKLATMGELAASVAHELNNPLATVTLQAESALEALPPGDPKRHALEVISQEVERMATLVSNLLLFSRRGHRQISTVDLREELTNTLDFIEYHLRSHKIDIVLDFAAALPTVQADRQQLRQVFLNLITNASDAMPEGGTLTFRSRAVVMAGGQTAVVVEFSDTGTGVQTGDLPKLWEPFFTTKPEGKGTGLGLAICRRTVEEHRGTIEIETGPGKGTTVRITLPATVAGIEVAA